MFQGIKVILLIHSNVKMYLKMKQLFPFKSENTIKNKYLNTT